MRWRGRRQSRNVEDRRGMLVAARAGVERYEELAELQVYPVKGNTRVERLVLIVDLILAVGSDTLLLKHPMAFVQIEQSP